jgi:hypothetical protein
MSKKQLLFSFLCIEKQKKILERSENFWRFLFLKIYLTFFEKHFFSKIFVSIQFFFCFSIHKKLNKSCSLNKIFLFKKKKSVSLKKTTFEMLWSEVWKGGFQLMLILDPKNVFLIFRNFNPLTSSLLFRLAVAILWDHGLLLRIVSKNLSLWRKKKNKRLGSIRIQLVLSNFNEWMLLVIKLDFYSEKLGMVYRTLHTSDSDLHQ